MFNINNYNPSSIIAIIFREVRYVRSIESTGLGKGLYLDLVLACIWLDTTCDMTCQEKMTKDWLERWLESHVYILAIKTPTHELVLTVGDVWSESLFKWCKLYTEFWQVSALTHHSTEQNSSAMHRMPFVVCMCWLIQYITIYLSVHCVCTFSAWRR